MKRVLTTMLGLLLLAGCGTWTWRVPALHYGVADAPAVVHPGLEGAVIAPESYAIASAEVAGQDMDAVMARLAKDGQRRGADAVVMMDFETMTAHWSAHHWADGEERTEIGRRETVETAETWATVQATALRSPTWCLGLDLACEDVDGACSVRIDRIVLGGPAEAAGLRVGNRVSAVGTTPVFHPWDVHQQVDAANGKAIILLVDGPAAASELSLQPMACRDLYEEAAQAVDLDADPVD